MNNRQISALIKSKKYLSKTFKGVFASDTLPYIPCPGSYIINEDPSDMPGSHWIAILIPLKGLPEYFCSYGREPLSTCILNFLGSDYKYNGTQIQSPITTTCGQHTIYYIWKRYCNESMDDIINSFSDNLYKNDVFVNDIIEKQFDVDLDVLDVKFLNKQICKALK